MIPEALAEGGPTEVIELLLSNGADAAAAGPGGRSPYRQADRETAMRLAAEHPGLPGRLTAAEAATIATAAEAGDAAAVAVMLDVGLPIDARGDGHGATALPAAARAGSVETVTLLLTRGAEIEARDSTFKANAPEWAVVGSGEQPSSAAAPGWEAAVRILLDAGSSTDGIILAAGDPKQPSPEVTSLLRARGVAIRT